MVDYSEVDKAFTEASKVIKDLIMTSADYANIMIKYPETFAEINRIEALSQPTKKDVDRWKECIISSFKKHKSRNKMNQIKEGVTGGWR